MASDQRRVDLLDAIYERAHAALECGKAASVLRWEDLAAALQEIEELAAMGLEDVPWERSDDSAR
jgi:hypothetical protein